MADRATIVPLDQVGYLRRRWRRLRQHRERRRAPDTSAGDASKVSGVCGGAGAIQPPREWMSWPSCSVSSCAWFTNQ